ncbi:MAG: ATP-binding protein [Acidovorax sp.]|nr:ATP-binding protein [Rhodoferax sp.]MBP8225776.1 ATP-binding protein [Acidovorax sp.]
MNIPIDQPVLQRHLLAQARDRLDYYPGVVLLGPRQVGKTTLARTLAANIEGSIFLDLERASDQAQLQDPERFFSTHRNRLVVLDEVQAMPNIFEALRPEIDADRRPGRFFLLGSASGKLLRQSAESLAGRVSYLELSPLLAHELLPPTATDTPTREDPDALLTLQRLMLRGGFPLSYTASSDARSLQWRQDMIQTFLMRDLPQLGVTIPAATLHRVWRMLAHNHGQLFNAAQIGQALGGVAHTTIGRYLDLFVDAMMLRRLPPLHVNLGKRLVKSPKVYVRDSGLLHALLQLGTVHDLQGHPVAGASWEGMVVEHVAACAPAGAEVTFYRTAAGAELDAVVSVGERHVAFEAKFSSAPKPTKGFWQACQDLAVQRAYVVAPVRASYPIADKVSVIALQDIATVFATPA